jgi:hypothetical protein
MTIEFSPRVKSVERNRGVINHHIEDENYYWSGEPPKIIFATSSPRKLEMWTRRLNGLSFLGNQDEMPQSFYSELGQINNQDGANNVEPRLIGYYKGAEVWVERQSGETEGNDPQEQATRKAQCLEGKYRGTNTIIMSTDTVGVDTEGNYYGKPANGGGDVDEEEYVKNWLERGSSTVTGLAVIDCLHGTTESQRMEIKTEIPIGIDPKKIVIDPCSGEGGLPQQVVEWDKIYPGWKDDPEVYLEMMDRASAYAGSTPIPLLEMARELRIELRKKKCPYGHFPESEKSRDGEGNVIAVSGMLVDPEQRKTQSSFRTQEVLGHPEVWEQAGILPDRKMEGIPRLLGNIEA